MTPHEVAALMQKLCKFDDIVPDDNFFDVGGTSLLAIELISAIENTSGTTLSLIDIIHSPTPAGISRLITAART